MKKNSYQILKLNLDDLLEAKKWLVHSYQVCESFKSKEKFSVSDYDALESFLSRFARVCDLLFRKVFRSIDVYELEPQGSLLDVLNRSEKKDWSILLNRRESGQNYETRLSTTTPITI